MLFQLGYHPVSTRRKGNPVNSKSDVLMKTTEKLIESAIDFGFELVVCGGIAVHILSDYLKRDSPRPWNHKDIDFIVPLRQFSRAIAFFKSDGYMRVFVPHKKARLTENHIRFGKIIDNTKVLVDLYGEPEISVVKIKRNNIEIPLLSPKIELENWKDREKRLGPKPSISLSIKFLNHIVSEELLEEEELT